MRLIKRAFFLVMLTAAGSLFAQAAPANAGGVSLEAEIQNIERTVSMQGISAVERHDGLVRLARLRQLSGDIEGAARNWLEAAAAIPGQVDDDALLSCAYCLAAMGEWDRAAAALDPLLFKSARARFLSVSITAINTGDTSALAALAGIVEYSQLKSEIYFMLWKTSSGESAENWRRGLAAEFPQTPEGRLAAVGSLADSASAIVVKPSPFWFFASGIDYLPLMENAGASPSTTVTASAPVPQPPSAQARLQAGLFSRQANAQAQMTSLRHAGFSPSLEQRGEMWAVTVPQGADQARSIKELKDAGFDSFPVR